MTRPLTAPLLTSMTLTAAFALTGCGSTQLPPGYTWNVAPQQQTEHKQPRGSYRWGFDSRRINESAPATARDAGRYDFAGVLPQPSGAADPNAAARASDYTRLDDVPDSVRPVGYGSDRPVFATAPASASGSSYGQSAGASGSAQPTSLGAFRAPTEIRILTSPDAAAPGSAPAAPAVGAAASGSRTHVVQKGDNYWDLAKQYYGKGIRFTDIQKANPDKDPTKLQIGDTIVIPE